MRRFSWALVPFLAALLLSTSLVGSIDISMDTQSIDFTSPEFLHTIMPSFYKPDTDQVCFHNGVRYTSCTPDSGRLVPLDVSDRYQLGQLLQSRAGVPGTIQLAVYVMLVNLGKSIAVEHENPKPFSKGSIGDLMHPTRGKKDPKQLTVNIRDMDPAIDGPRAARRYGAPAVSREEDACYQNWLLQKAYAGEAVDTVLNELYVRHVAITQGNKKQWEIQSPTGCYQNPGYSSDVPKLKQGKNAPKERRAWDELGKDHGPGIHVLQERKVHSDPNDRDGDGILDDMEVYHPILGTHLKDPWEKYRRFAHNGSIIHSGEFGHRKRAVGGEYWVGHRHAKRGDDHRDKQKDTAGQGQDKAAGKSGAYIPGVGADYNAGMPSTPTAQSGAGAGTVPGAGTPGGTSAGISSKPHGFAASVTGGGSANPVIPKDIKELESLLGDAQPRVIHLDKVYDFRGSAGVCTNCKGCIPDSYPKCPSKGQLAIDNGEGWCNGRPATSVTYDKAGLTPIKVGPNKSVIGVSSTAGIRGRGLAVKHVKNVILHNFRIDEINAPYIWGGDGVTLFDTDLVWIDKLTFSHIGRQHIVTGYAAAGRVTISNCLFDCETKWSATCDDSHYWTVLGYGKSDRVTFSGNLMRHCSGRSPRIANPDEVNGDSVWHVVNTLFEHNTGHSLDMGPGISVLIEGNVFSDVAQTSLHENSPGRAFAPSDSAVCSQCKGPLGRDCQPNAYSNASPVPSTTTPGQVLKDIAQEKVAGALPPSQVAASTQQNAGCGGGGASTSPAADTDAGAAPDGAQSAGGGVAAGASNPAGGTASGGATTNPGPAPGTAPGGAYVPGDGKQATSPGGSTLGSGQPQQPVGGGGAGASSPAPGTSPGGAYVPGVGKQGMPPAGNKAAPGQPQQPVGGGGAVIGGTPNPGNTGATKEGYSAAQPSAQQQQQQQQLQQLQKAAQKAAHDKQKKKDEKDRPKKPFWSGP